MRLVGYFAGAALLGVGLMMMAADHHTNAWWTATGFITGISGAVLIGRARNGRRPSAHCQRKTDVEATIQDDSP